MAEAEVAQLGAVLRDARLSHGLSLEDVAEILRIRRVYLAALEEGRLRDLPAAAYVIGFVRSYAAALGLDADAMVERFRAATSASPLRHRDLVFPEPPPERGIPAGVVILAGVVLVIGAYTAWFQWSGSGTRTVDTVPPMPARLEQVLREAPPQAAPPPGPPAASAAAAPNPPGPPGLASPGPLPAAPAPVAAARGAEEPRIQLRARAESWVSLRDRATGQVVTSRMLKPGEVMAVPPREGLTLTLGNAPGVELLVDGQPTPGIGGANGAVRRDIPLEPERLKAGNYSPATSAGNEPQRPATTPPRPRPAARPAEPPPPQ